MLLAGILATVSPPFRTLSNVENVLQQISVNGIMAVGMTLVIITAGIDLSVGSVLALSAVVATSFAHPMTISYWCRWRSVCWSGSPAAPSMAF